MLVDNKIKEELFEDAGDIRVQKARLYVKTEKVDITKIKDIKKIKQLKRKEKYMVKQPLGIELVKKGIATELDIENLPTNVVKLPAEIPDDWDMYLLENAKEESRGR